MNALLIHAWLMVVAWLVLAPIAIVVARYLKVMPRQRWPERLDNPAWWRIHLAATCAALAIATTAFFIAVGRLGAINLHSWHARVGVAALCLGWLQAASGAFRGTKGGPTDRRAILADPASWRGDHYDMTRRRKLFEAWHRPAGFCTVLLAVLAVWLGFDGGLVHAPRLWDVCVAAVSLTILAMLLLPIVHERVSTYEAIWGPTGKPPTRPRRRANQLFRGGGALIVAVVAFSAASTGPPGTHDRDLAVPADTPSAAIYAKHCESCHGLDASGRRGIAPSLVEHPIGLSRASEFRRRIETGGGPMPAFGAVLTHAQIVSLVAFLEAVQNDRSLLPK